MFLFVFFFVLYNFGVFFCFNKDISFIRFWFIRIILFNLNDFVKGLNFKSSYFEGYCQINNIGFDF